MKRYAAGFRFFRHSFSKWEMESTNVDHVLTSSWDKHLQAIHFKQEDITLGHDL